MNIAEIDLVEILDRQADKFRTLVKEEISAIREDIKEDVKSIHRDIKDMNTAISENHSEIKLLKAHEERQDGTVQKHKIELKGMIGQVEHEFEEYKGKTDKTLYGNGDPQKGVVCKLGNATDVLEEFIKENKHKKRRKRDVFFEICKIFVSPSIAAMITAFIMKGS